MEKLIETQDAKLALQLGGFCFSIGDYSTLLGLELAKVNQIKADNTNFAYMHGNTEPFRNYASGVIANKNLLRYGKDENVLINIVQPPQWPTVVPTDMKAGVQLRFSEIIDDCMNSKNFTRGIGEALGIIKPEGVFVPSEGKPNAVGELGNGGLPQLGATKGKYEGYSIYKDSGSGYKFYDKSIHHSWIDQREALPTAGTSKTWKYKLIYLYKGKEVGSFSDEIIIVVFGNI